MTRFDEMAMGELLCLWTCLMEDFRRLEDEWYALEADKVMAQIKAKNDA